MTTLHIVPWHCDIFAALEELMASLAPERMAGGDLSDFLVVFPHLRPRKYLRRRLLQSSRVPAPCRPPECLTTGQLFARLRIALEQGALAGAPLRVAERLDRVDVLRQSVQALEQDSGPLSRLPATEPTLFIPWGLRLERLLEEFTRQDLTPQNLPYAEEHVQPFAADLLAQLGDIAADYDARLEAQGLTTPARDARRVIRHLYDACDLLRERRLLLAGFSRLDALEEKLFHELWKRGAQIVLHSDPALASPAGRHGSCHWSCEAHAELARRWKGRPELLLPPGAQATAPVPKIRFCEGFDLHSQLDVLQQELSDLQQHGRSNATIVLPDTSLLMPALHHLPDKDAVNISMGYPLARSPLALLVDCLLRLQETARGPGLYYWKDLVECLRHPYLKSLRTGSSAPGQEGAGLPLRLALHAMETAVRTGQTFFRPLTWEPPLESGGWSGLLDRTEAADEQNAQDLRALFTETLATCLSAWEQVDSLAAATNALQRLCDLLRGCGAELWQRFPIDAECLHRLLYNVIPGLRQSSLATEPLPRDTVFAILRQALQEERAPFDSENLDGLQVLGLLETRLLTTETVFLLDATDDVLPGPPGNDPLLPDPLRRLVGLPDSSNRERDTAQHFFRLLHGARDVLLLYQTSVETGGLLEEKRLRSRFVEELLWLKERETGRLLTPGEDPVRLVSYPVSAPLRVRRHIRKNTQVREALQRVLDYKLSPSALDVYLHCPAQFFYTRLCNLQGPDEVMEEGDPMEIGTLVHDALLHYFADRLNTPLHAGNLDPEALEAVYLEQLCNKDFYGRIPFDQRLMLQKTGPILLREYLESLKNMPPATVLEVETPLEGGAMLDGREVKLQGKADRIDRRDQGVMVLDYKTGRIASPRLDFWEDTAFWQRMDAWTPTSGDDTLLQELAETLHSVQLPCYCLLYWQMKNVVPWDAALVGLRDKGKEEPLFGDKPEMAFRNTVIRQRIPELLGFVLRHMVQSETFAPQESRRCDWCEAAASCAGGLASQTSRVR